MEKYRYNLSICKRYYFQSMMLILILNFGALISVPKIVFNHEESSQILKYWLIVLSQDAIILFGGQNS